MKFKAVIFDLYGTLVHNFPYTESNDILKRMALELTVSPEDFMSMWHDGFEKRMTGVFRNYQDCIGYICRQLRTPVRDDKVELAASIRFEMNGREVRKPRDGAIEVLEYLKSNDCKIGLISDCSMETTMVWKDSPLSTLIDEPVFSCLVGVKKPDPQIYQIAVDRLSVSPEECIYVADGIGRELDGAMEFGMYPVQILVPGEDDYDPYRAEWNGPVISSLREVIALVND